MSKIVLKNSILRQKAQNFAHFGLYGLVQISPACVLNTYQIMCEVCEEILDFQGNAMVAREGFNGKFTAKFDFPIGHLYYQLLTLTLEVYKVPLHII